MRRDKDTYRALDADEVLYQAEKLLNFRGSDDEWFESKGFWPADKQAILDALPLVAAGPTPWWRDENAT